ncbi:hypothetical protein [Paraburkholderia tuberum]|uniref:MFS transporter, DHA2 family, multidrug resistance protein n=2 Tax=Paraburkholderia TaxID=1822464 RepID=A0A1H1J840_9BURK|nr:hypothetical protein [Paraburkholderia tuberum]SDR46157.1 MFS transporter, DHA2 family, multidrug resistance protein [Paraburkholderia tuberum]
MASFDEPSILSEYNRGEKLIAGIVLAVVTFWLFAQTTLNVLQSMWADLQIDDGLSDIAVSITALFSGVFIVVAGWLADRVGRVKINQGSVAHCPASSVVCRPPVCA